MKNTVTNRLLFCSGSPIIKSNEGGWLKSPKILGTDANYYNRAAWNLIKNGNTYLLQDMLTKRYLFSTGAKATHDEGGWLKSPSIVGTDLNYYHRAEWYITFHGSDVHLKNKVTDRYLFSSGKEVSAPEGGWLKSPDILGTDGNYYGRAAWKISGPGVSMLKPKKNKADEDCPFWLVWPFGCFNSFRVATQDIKDPSEVHE